MKEKDSIEAGLGCKVSESRLLVLVVLSVSLVVALVIVLVVVTVYIPEGVAQPEKPRRPT